MTKDVGTMFEQWRDGREQHGGVWGTVVLVSWAGGSCRKAARRREGQGQHWRGGGEGRM